MPYTYASNTLVYCQVPPGERRIFTVACTCSLVPLLSVLAFWHLVYLSRKAVCADVCHGARTLPPCAGLCTALGEIVDCRADLRLAEKRVNTIPINQNWLICLSRFS